MAFLIQQVDGGRVPGIEYLPCGAITPRIGMALIQSGGTWLSPAERLHHLCEHDREGDALHGGGHHPRYAGAARHDV